MKLIYTYHFLILLILFPIILSNAQTTNDYRSVATGNWSSLATWERFNGTTWVQPTSGEGVPSSSSGVITIQNGHTVSIPNVNQTADQMTINSGGQVNIGTGRTLTIANGTGTDLTVNGILVNTGTLTFNSGVTASFGSGSIYQHNKDGGVIPTATWNSNSTCLVTGTVGTIPTGMGQTFGHLTWNCPNQTVASTPPTTYNLLGNLTVQNTGTGQFRMGTGITSDNIVLGNYSQSGGTVRISGATARVLNVSGNFNLNGGTFLMSDNTTIGTLNVAGNFSHSAGTITQTLTGGSGVIIFNGTTNQSYTGGGTISGTINFTFNNPAGITLSTSVTFPTTLTMSNGNIALNGNTFTLGTSTTTKGTLSWSAGFLTGSGTFTRWFDNSTAISIGTNAGLFPMGNGTDNRSVWIAGTPSTGGTLSVQHTNASGTTALSFVENLQTFNKRTNMNWTLSNANGFAGSSLSLRIQGSGIPGINQVSDLNISLASTAAGGTYSAPGGNTTNPQVNRTGLTQTTLANTFYFAATSASPLPVELSSFSAIVLDNGVKLNWRTETEVNNYGFQVQRAMSNVQGQDWDVIGFVEGHGNSNSPKEYSFFDENVIDGKYSYRLKQIDFEGKFEYSKVIEVEIGSPGKFELSQNYPNPFNPTTTIRFSLPQSGNVKLTIYNTLGEQVAELVNGFLEAGVYTFNFDASTLNSGVYIYKLNAENILISKKMSLIK